MTTTISLGETFSQFLTDLQLDPNYDAIVQARHAAVRRAVEAALPGAKTHLVGSLQRRTRIDPERGLDGFDIDILVEMGSFYRWVQQGGVQPDAALSGLHSAVTTYTRYAKMDTMADAPVVVIPYADGSSVELIPAYRDQTGDLSPTGRAFWVPVDGRWSRADYDFDAQSISEANRECDGKLVPAIKALRAWRRHSAPQLRGFHLEVLAANSLPLLVGAYRSMGFSLSVPTAVMWLLGAVGVEISSGRQHALAGSLSEPMGAYLGPHSRALVGYCAERDAKLLADADSLPVREAIRTWSNVLGAPFPAA